MGKNAALHRNILDLTRIHLLQNRSYMLMLAGSFFFATLYFAFNDMQTELDSWEIGNVNSMVIFLGIFILFVALRNFHLVSQDRISMYPGTMRSRLLSRLLADHIMLLAAVLFSVFLYFAQGLLLYTMGRTGEGFLAGGAWSGSYLWYGSMRFAGYLFCLYGISALWFSLLSQFRNALVGSDARKAMIYGGVFLFVIVCTIFWTERTHGVLHKFFEFFFAGKHSFAELMAVTWGIWAVCILLTILIGGSVSAWRRQEMLHVVFSALFGYIGSIFLIFGLYAGSRSDSEEFSVGQFYDKTDHQVEHRLDIRNIPRDQLADLPVAEIMQGGGGEVIPMSLGCTVSEAKRLGLSFDESAVDRDHVVELIGSTDAVFAGKDLLEPLLVRYQDRVSVEYTDETEEEASALSYCLSGPMQRIGVNAFYGNVYRYMDNTNLNLERGQNVVDYFRRVLIFSDEYRDIWEEEGN